MFKQNSKKQTVLSFGQKPKTTSAPKPLVDNTRSNLISTQKNNTRPTPYSRPQASRQSSKGSGTYSSTTTSPFFANAQESRAQSYDARNNKPYLSRMDSFGSEVSAMVSSNGRVSSSMDMVTGSVATGIIRPSGRVALSPRQIEAFNKAVNHRDSLFITGSAGTGKSVLLCEIIRALKDDCKLHDLEVVTTASTGIAAFHVGGKTINSFAGIGLGQGTKETMLKFVRKSGLALKRWSTVKVLVIDEISMLDARIFDALEFIAREVRRNKRFFGGIQVILTGDFYQLPPVEKQGDARFAFEAEAWQKGITNTVVLTHVFRQKDMRFIDVLNEMRLGKLSENGTRVFRDLARVPQYPDDGIQPTELYSLRSQVDESNRRRLQSLKGDIILFAAHDERVTKNSKYQQQQQQWVPEDVRAKIDAMSMAPRRLELKQYAQVMLVKNMPENNLVNGSRGVVTRFSEVANRQYPVVRFTNGTEILIVPETLEIDVNHQTYARTQLPLILAWALSIHKSQGQTIDRLLVDLGKVFERGQAYVALSRAVSLDSLQVLNFNPQCVMAHPRVIQYYADLARRG